MERHVMMKAPAGAHRPVLRLAAEYGGRLADRQEIAPIDSPELPMTVRFEGITPAQQRAALAAFPGGRRFVLAS